MARPKAGSELSIAQLESLLESRRKDHSTLTAERARLQKELDAIDKKLGGMGIKSGRGGRRPMGAPVGGRARNSKSLVETLAEVLDGSTEPMKVGDIVDSVLKKGYQTTSDNFRGIVNQTLIKERKRFGNAGRGMYVSKAKA